VIRVKISSGSPASADFLLRQLPHDSPTLSHVEFCVNQQVPFCDWWFVLHPSSLTSEEQTLCDPRHIVLVTMEPPEWGRPSQFYRQFSQIVSCDASIGPSRIDQNWSSWWVGLNVSFDHHGRHQIKCNTSINHDYFSNLLPARKLDRISVVTSNKAIFPGHLNRLHFLDFLSSHPVSKYIDFYGAGHAPVTDKLDVLSPYKYHLCLENSITKNYWTEKISDPFLAWCLPFYSGCPNVLDFFPAGSLYRVNVDNWKESADLMLRAVEGGVYDSALGSIGKARDLLLGKYNIFTQISRLANVEASAFQNCILKPLVTPSSRIKLETLITHSILSRLPKLNRQ